MVVQTPQRRLRSGVTLIEAIMVITLLAAAGTISLYRFDRQWMARRNVTAVTNDVANSLITARNTAISSQSTVRVRRARVRGVEQLRITEEPGPLRNGRSWTFDLGNNARVSGRPREIRFRPDGSSNRRLAWRVRRSRTRGQVQVAPGNGQITRVLP